MKLRSRAILARRLSVLPWAPPLAQPASAESFRTFSLRSSLNSRTTDFAAQVEGPSVSEPFRGQFLRNPVVIAQQ